MDNYRKKVDKIPVAFINLHINKAVEDESHDIFISNNRIMANHFNKKEKYKKMLEYEPSKYESRHKKQRIPSERDRSDRQNLRIHTPVYS